MRRVLAALVIVAVPAIALLHFGCSNLDAVLVPGDGGGSSTCPPPRPAEGVYEYTTGQGLPVIETITLGDASIPMTLGPDFTGTVRHTAKGYTVFLDLGFGHSSFLNLENESAGVIVTGWEESVFGTTTSVQCGPPPLSWAPCGTDVKLWPIGCIGANSLIDGGFNVVGSRRLAGESSVVVGGVALSATQYVDTRNIQGTVVGTQDLEWWLSKDTGLPLRAIFSARVTLPSPTGEPASYSSNLDYRLKSLTPKPLP